MGNASGLLLVLTLFNREGIRHVLPYAVTGILLWLVLLESGIYATIAGIMPAFAIPARPSHTLLQFDMRVEKLKQRFLAATFSDDGIDHPLSKHRITAIAEDVKKPPKQSSCSFGDWNTCYLPG